MDDINKPKIFFILHNIYESTNGVSNKYIKFIDYLTNLSYQVTLLTTSKNNSTINGTNMNKMNMNETNMNKMNMNETNMNKMNMNETNMNETNMNETNMNETNMNETNMNETNMNETNMNEMNKMNININNKYLKIIKLKGLNIPFYKEIKIPTLTFNKIDELIQNGNEIIVFNGEFIWLYDILKNLKNKYKNIKLYPTMHTDYEYYINNIYNKYKFFSNINYLNHLNHYLEIKIFNGIIVTGNKMVLKYSNYTNSIFNANEVDLSIFNKIKHNNYDININNIINIIYCGRISKEKNIDDFLEYCNDLHKSFYIETKIVDFLFNIIGDGPYLDNIKSIIEIQYKDIKDKFIFYGNLSGNKINTLYQKLNNRIFLFTSNSETFGKTPIEAIATGIPAFIKKSDITNDIYINKKNAFIFENKNELIEYFLLFIKMNSLEKQLFINNSITNIKKYDQSIIFNDWIEFLINGKLNKDKSKFNFIDMITLFGIGKFVNCSGMIIGD
jgi:glycosyltransferase involved in cell wall biosynthesis